MIEQQAARIKELEAELDHWKWLATHYLNKLTALRKKIEDAPVVAEVVQMFGGSGCMTRMVRNAQTPPLGTKLISKEDLL